MRIKYGNICEELAAVFVANNLYWTGDRYWYYFVEHLASNPQPG
jgi:hypothetical protein